MELMPSGTGDTHTVYFIDSTFYCWLTAMNIVDPIKISPADLDLLKEKVLL